MAADDGTVNATLGRHAGEGGRTLDHLRGIVNEPFKVVVWAYYAWRFVVARVVRGESGTVYFVPDQPLIVYSIWKICRELGLRITSDDTADCVAAVSWDDATFNRYRPARPPCASGRLINERCVDISKTKVEDASLATFGYGLAIDPRSFVGPYVRKSDENALHDGIVIESARDPEPGIVYQRLVNTVAGDERVLDLRVPIMGRRIPLVYLRHRDVKERFTQLHDCVEVCPTDRVLTDQEVATLLAFCAAIGLDFGELDVLRDCDDGRLHVVDANKTPAGPPKHIRWWDGVRAIGILARAFDEEFLAGRG
ncbi:hypothetical protein [Pseudolysinimonas sp.]|uniref:hypothetical protein n=1 Tax=Pseudolysinimonas sp. TaxID=2680009 RepID=UPI00286CCAF0|nr:hypothetical protein [Pseudolysinimonas sp.]